MSDRKYAYDLKSVSENAIEVSKKTSQNVYVYQQNSEYFGCFVGDRPFNGVGVLVVIYRNGVSVKA